MRTEWLLAKDFPLTGNGVRNGHPIVAGAFCGAVRGICNSPPPRARVSQSNFFKTISFLRRRFPRQQIELEFIPA
jgi:hypothetical protein